MKRQTLNREKQVLKLARRNRWYQHERFKKYLSPQNREAEVRILDKDLKI